MRIGIAAQQIFRRKKNEADLYALELIKRLQLLDNVNEYFIFAKPGKDTSWIKKAVNFTIVEVPGMTRIDWEQWNLPRIARRYRLDVLHCTSGTAPLSCDIPVYLTLHDVHCGSRSCAGGTLPRHLEQIYTQRILPHVFLKATRVITSSRSEKENMKGRFGHTGKVEVINHGIAHKFKVLPDKILRMAKKAIDLPDRYLLFLGDTSPDKNMKGLLQAYAMYTRDTCQPLPLVITGSTDGEVKSMLKAIGEKDKTLFRHIYLTGHILPDLLPTVYALADVFLYPSLKDSFCMPIIEAMACGTPVITSYTSAMPEIAGDSALLVNPTLPVDIVRKIQAITQIPQFHQEMVKAGLQRAADFSWIETAFRTLESYNEMNKEMLRVK